jgi:hypothetical protein
MIQNILNPRSASTDTTRRIKANGTSAWRIGRWLILQAAERKRAGLKMVAKKN